METRRLLITGKVQGVYYRATMVQVAVGQGVTGWVRNLGDGRVEAMIQGDGEAIARMIAWAQRGPEAAVVEEVLVEEADGRFEEFVQIATL